MVTWIALGISVVAGIGGVCCAVSATRSARRAEAARDSITTPQDTTGKAGRPLA